MAMFPALKRRAKLKSRSAARESNLKTQEKMTEPQVLHDGLHNIFVTTDNLFVTTDNLKEDKIQTSIERLQPRQVIDLLHKIPRVRVAIGVANEVIRLDLFEPVLILASQPV